MKCAPLRATEKLLGKEDQGWHSVRRTFRRARRVPGYVVTRLQIAFQREVFYLLDNDFLSPEELDEAAKWGLAMRMMVVGVVQ